ncbi:DUF305 domain-containing protein [Herbiconiux moechotypicola]|uniref:DUF305 domain-containing protein n=1 Tax=Herbiconiux moechotypicola TaxID=637393 RepID=A0ABP5QVM8_9MICO|nr:DUF305 domain-containing protein [Herbiconiux moechotypicola]MCS5731110.1 DUF305 domain-containing protein [Herbiconiux moechotypicola]
MSDSTDGPRSGEGSDGGTGAERPVGVPAASSKTPKGRLVLAGVVAAVVVVLGAFAAGWLSAPRVPVPGDTSVEAGFARDMQQHHDQAVQMAMIVRDETDDPDVRQLAYDIATSQSQQSGQMYAWLNAWGLPQASSQPSMTWMLQPTLDGSDNGHGGHAGSATASSGSGDMVPGGPMPGMASDEDIQRLGELSGVDAERLFLQLMIAHHQGGVEMAEAVEARTTNPLVLALAKAVIFAQSGEIDYMTELLAERG